MKKNLLLLIALLPMVKLSGASKDVGKILHSSTQAVIAELHAIAEEEARRDEAAKRSDRARTLGVIREARGGHGGGSDEEERFAALSSLGALRALVDTFVDTEGKRWVRALVRSGAEKMLGREKLDLEYVEGIDGGLEGQIIANMTLDKDVERSINILLNAFSAKLDGKAGFIYDAAKARNSVKADVQATVLPIMEKFVTDMNEARLVLAAASTAFTDADPEDEKKKKK